MDLVLVSSVRGFYQRSFYDLRRELEPKHGSEKNIYSLTLVSASEVYDVRSGSNWKESS